MNCFEIVMKTISMRCSKMFYINPVHSMQIGKNIKNEDKEKINKIPNNENAITTEHPKLLDEQTDYDANQTDKDAHMGTCDMERYSYWPSCVPSSISSSCFETKFLSVFPSSTKRVLFRSFVFW